MKKLFSDFSKPDNIFLIGGSQTYTYADLSIESAKFSKDLSEQFEKMFFVLESQNSFYCYAKVLALLIKRIPFLLLPTYQFHSSAYRNFLADELGLNLRFVEKASSFANFSSVSSGKKNIDGVVYNDALVPFVVKTSGSSGSANKFILHDAALFVNKYHDIGKHFQKTFAFSPLESIAGMETFLEVLTHETTLATSEDDFSPQIISRILSENKIDYFQTTPSFINLWLASGNVESNRLASLKKIAYGSEPSSKSALLSLKKLVPQAELVHTYGMSEIGILKTKTPQDRPNLFLPDNLFNPVKIIDSRLYVKSRTPPVAILNKAFQGDDWFNTEDFVSEEGGYIEVRGRNSDLLNVGGRKFFPSEVESVLSEMPEIEEVVVVKEQNAFLGHSLYCKIFPRAEVFFNVSDFDKNFKLFCSQRLPPHMRPLRYELTKERLINSRFKKVRS